MKHRLFVALAFFAIAFGACGDNPPGKGDAGVDARAVDANVSADVRPPDRQSSDTAGNPGIDAGTPVPDSSPGDTGASDLAADAGGTVDTAPADTGSPDTARDTVAAPDAGPTCGPGASREMLCTTYCDGIGRFCSRGDTQYPNADACRAACNAPTWACGSPGQTMGNTLFCRLAHMALAGVGAAATECPNAGPSSPACQ